MELARVGRVALIGELAASLAHEVNNPIGAMVANANAAQRLIAKGQIEEPEFQAILADIVSDGYRAREVIQGIRNMVRKSETIHALIRMNEVIRDLLRIVRADALAREVTLVTDIDPHLGMVTGDRVQLLQVLLNLTINAFEALSVIRAGERRVTIRARRSDDASLSVTVHDSGPGFPKGLTDQLFESFFSTKAEGTGMGLAIARSIAASHGGTLLAENVEGGGACFTLRLPEAKDDQSEAA
jgi:two-component system, LuxR family, sensor kinase FixL